MNAQRSPVVSLPAGTAARVRLDRYAAKDPHATLKPGDLVVLSVQRYYRHKGKPGESREIGIVQQGDGQHFSVVVFKQTAPLADRQDSGAIITVAPHENDQYEVLTGVPRASLEYVVEKTWEQICARVADGAVKLERQQAKRNRKALAEIQAFRDRIYNAMCTGKFVAAGRILTGMGRDDLPDLTLFNCYVYAIPGDSRQAIVQHLGRIFDTYARGGGVGWDLSILRPKGAVVKKVSGRSSGIITWAELYSHLTGSVEQGGSRMGAASQSLQAWHPDIFDFIEAKSWRENIVVEGQAFSRNRNLIKNANVSVLLSNEFMEAVKQDRDWDLVFPDLDDPEYDAVWNGDLTAWKRRGKQVVKYRTIKARDLWYKIIRHAWESGEPGILFLGRANELSNSYYYNQLVCGNPCFEIISPPNGICNLSHVNIAAFVTRKTLPERETTADEATAWFDWHAFEQACQDGVRFLDNAIDLNHYHEDVVEQQGKLERRIGLGLLGIGEALMRLGLRYGSPEALIFTRRLVRALQIASYMASVSLARQRGCFPAFDTEKFLASGFMQQIGSEEEELVAWIRHHGMRNVTCNTIAPTGSIAAILGTTSGIEPYFDLEYTSTTRIGTTEERAGIVEQLTNQFGTNRNAWPSYVVTAQNGIAPEQHVKMQAAAQRYIDAAISKTINLPNSATVEDVANTYQLMWELGCKGGTIYRDGSRDEQVLYTKDATQSPPKTVPITVSSDRISDAVAPRLDVGVGPIFSVESPTGTLHIGIRHDPETGDPSDLFLISGYGDIGADVQAIGRLCSLIMRLRGVPVSQQSKLELIREQLSGIPGRTQMGFAHDLKLSMPDAFAKVIQRYLEGDFPLANLPFGAQQIDSIFQAFAGLQPEARRDVIAYLKNMQAVPTQPEAVALPAPEEVLPVAQRDFCPACHGASLMVTPGKCSYCRACGYSRCG